MNKYFEPLIFFCLNIDNKNSNFILANVFTDKVNLEKFKIYLVILNFIEIYDNPFKNKITFICEICAVDKK